MSYKVFISSTNEDLDLDLARDLYQRLKKAGIEVYSVHKAGAVGDYIATSLKEGLSKADEVVTIVTSNSAKSPGLMSELGMAFSLHKQVTPVLVGLKPTDLPSIIKHTKFIKYADLNKYISQLEKRAKKAA